MQRSKIITEVITTASRKMPSVNLGFKGFSKLFKNLQKSKI